MNAWIGYLLSFLIVAAAAKAEERWDVLIASVATKPGYINPGVDFVVDAAGTFHACYASTEVTEDTVTYLRWTPGGLQEKVKLTNKPRNAYVPKIALTPSGDPVVLFVDGDGLKLAKCVGGTWGAELLSSNGHYGFADLSLAIDSSGHAHVLFNGTNYVDSVYLRYMHEDGIEWITNDFLPPVPLYGSHGGFHDLVLDQDDSPHIIYQESSGGSPYYPVKYVYRNPDGEFVTEHVSDYNNLQDIEMARSAEGVIHVVHPYSNSYLSYCRRGLDGVWHEQLVVDSQTGLNIQMDHADITLERGTPVIGYKRSGSPALSLAIPESGAWKCSEIRNSVSSFSPRIGQDHRGNLCFIYSLYTGVGLIFPPSSHLPNVEIGMTDINSLSIDIEGLTPGVSYELMQSPDLQNWNRIQDFSSGSGNHTFETPMSENQSFFRVQLPPPPPATGQ